MKKPTYPRVKIERGRDVMVESLLKGTETVVRVRIGTYQEGRLVIKPKWKGDLSETELKWIKTEVGRIITQRLLHKERKAELIRLSEIASERAKKRPDWWETAE